MRAVLCYICLCIAAMSYAQQATLRGSLQNEQSGAFIKGGVLFIGNVAVKTDSNGFFSRTLEAGKYYDITIKQSGFKKQQQKIKINGDTTLVFFLSSEHINLDEVTVSVEKDNSFGISHLNNVEGTTIYAGKKSEAVYVQDLNANLAANNSRQVFSKIPGINVFENDGSGATISIGGRGLDPNRISNFNTRQNGYDISADALGYPESYYTPPTEAIERIEILRGAAGLQFGPQFGGMINYKFSEAPADKKISGDFRQTAGSYGFFNSFNRVAGTVKKFSYNTFYQYKHYTGWKGRSVLNSHNAFASLSYRVNEKLTVKGEYSFFNYLAQQPGGLTDKQFETDYTRVTRQRNWFKVNWNLLSLSADYKVTESARISLVTFGLDASRDALGVLGRIDRPEDTTANRNLLSDKYTNFGAELRMLKRYLLFKQNSHFLIGARYYKGNTLRRQGDASAASDPDFRFLNPDNLENSNYTFPSLNYAVFAENIFQLSKRWCVTPGVRFEYIKTSSEGYYRLINRNLAGKVLLDMKVDDNRSLPRHFILAGVGTQYKLNDVIDLYANFSQNYRSINFNDMRVENANLQVDPNIRDERGFTADGGIRGVIKNILYFDVSLFLLSYNDRIGTTLKADSATYQLVRYRTNISDSRNAGVEAFAEIDWVKLIRKASRHKLSTFVNFSYINARYISSEKAYKNKQVEFVSPVIFRTGLSYAYNRKFGIGCQYSYTDKQFSDATNAVFSPSAVYGVIPAYSVIDLSANYTYKKVSVIAGVNNLADAKYFTRRAEGYPGPGILPADPRNFYVTLRLKL